MKWRQLFLLEAQRFVALGGIKILSVCGDDHIKYISEALTRNGMAGND